MKKAGFYILFSVMLAMNLILPVHGTEVSQVEEKEQSILFIGNSLTYYRAKGKNNYFLTYFEKMANSMDHKISISYVTKSGQKLSCWADEKNKDGKRAYKAIRSKEWDYVVLQENTDYAVANNNSFQKAAKKLSKEIYKNCPDTTIIYNCTWAYQKGKRLKGKYYSCSKMQKLLNQHYRQAAKATGGKISWAGNSFYNCRKLKKGIKLYVSDNNHPSRYGSYLSACSMYAAIFRESPAKSGYYLVGGKGQARFLQLIAAKVNLP